MISKTLLLNILFAGIYSTLFAQSSHFVLTEHKREVSPNSVDYIGQPIDFSKEKPFKGLPTQEDYRICCLDLQKEQTAYEDYLAKKELTEQQQSILEEQDTSRLSLLSTNHRVFIVIYFKNNKKIITADLNYNYDFSDDKVFEFTMSGKSVKKGSTEFIPVDIQYEYVENRKIIPRKFPVLVEPINKLFIYKDDSDGRFYVNVKQFEYVKGEITVDNVVYYFTACSGGGQKGVFKNFNLHFSPTPFADSIRFGFDQMLSSKDSILIGGNSYSPRFSTFGDTFFLEPYKLTHNNPVNLLEELSGKITIDNQKINLEKIKINDLTVIDFWGTWCSPCVKDLPKMEKIYKHYENKGVNFIGIAVDHDQQKVEKFLTSHPILYPVIYENLHFGSDFIFKKLNITVFPSYLLLNKQGNIVFSTNTITELESQLNLNTKR